MTKVFMLAWGKREKESKVFIVEREYFYANSSIISGLVRIKR
jgi:hypothetical protein